MPDNLQDYDDIPTVQKSHRNYKTIIAIYTAQK